MAEDSAPQAGPKYSLTLEGSFGRLDSAPHDKWGAVDGPSGFSDKAGAGQDLAYTGAISLSRSIGENRDVRFGLALGGNPPNVAADKTGYDNGNFGFSGSGLASVSVSNDFDFATMDIDTGRSRATAFGTLTTFGGVRGLVATSASDASTDKIGRDNSSGGAGNYTGSVGLQIESNFVGLGPRLGLGFESKPFAGRFGVSGEVAGGVVFGERKDNASVDKVGTSDVNGPVGPIDVPLASRTEKQTVQTLDAKASIDYHFSENTTLSLGYQARQFWNVDLYSDPDNIETGKNRLVDGAFIAFTTQF